MTIYLTDIEIRRVLDACVGYLESMSEGEDTYDCSLYELETGLGSALRKISKGRIIESAYRKYKTQSKYTTFEEWKADRAEKKGDKNE